MSYKSKYIIVDTGISEMPIVFPDLLSHSDVARGVAFGGKIHGAGFCHITEKGQYICYGESASLNVKSRFEIDSKILNKLLGADNS